MSNRCTVFDKCIERHISKFCVFHRWQFWSVLLISCCPISTSSTWVSCIFHGNTDFAPWVWTALFTIIRNKSLNLAYCTFLLFFRFRVKVFALGRKVRTWSKSITPSGSPVLVDTLALATTPSATNDGQAVQTQRNHKSLCGQT